MEYRFKEIRDNRELKQQEVASYLKVSRGGYANIESEIANVKLKNLLYYCNQLDLSMDYVCRLVDYNDTRHLYPLTEVDKKIMGARLTQIEEEQHLKAQELASFLGILNSTYSEYKNPKRSNLMQTLMVKNIAKKFGYSIDWIIGRSNTKKLK